MFITGLNAKRSPKLSKEEKKKRGIGRMGPGELMGTRVHKKEDKKLFRRTRDRRDVKSQMKEVARDY